MLSTSARDGSLFAKGFDPTRAQALHPVLDFHYTNTSFRAWGQPESGGVFALPDEVYIYDIPGSQMDNQEHSIGNITSYRSYQYKFHWSALIAIIVNFAKIEADGYVKWLVEETMHEMMLSEQYTTSYKGILQAHTMHILLAYTTISSSHVLFLSKVDLWESSVIKQRMQPGGDQAQSAFAREQALLPNTRTSNADKEAYHAFIQKFGTHYVHSAVFGSCLEMILSSSKTVAEKMEVKTSSLLLLLLLVLLLVLLVVVVLLLLVLLVLVLVLVLLLVLLVLLLLLLLLLVLVVLPLLVVLVRLLLPPPPSSSPPHPPHPSFPRPPLSSLPTSITARLVSSSQDSSWLAPRCVR
jgi:hypothetical protein